MDGVFPVPKLVGGEGEDAGDKSPDVASALGFEEGFVAAVVKNDEESDAESACEEDERDGKPGGDVVDEVHGDPES